MNDPVEVMPLRSISHGRYDLVAGAQAVVDGATAAALERAGMVRRLPQRPPGAVTPEDKLPAPTTPEEQLRSEWAETGLKSAPAVYLQRSPKGKHAGVAKRLVAAGLGAG